MSFEVKKKIIKILNVSLCPSDKRQSRNQFWESVMFKWSVLRQNAAGALGMLQHNSFRLRIIWANAANTPITHSLPRHWNLIFIVNIIPFMYVVSKCVAAILKLLRILVLFLIAMRNASGTFLIIPVAQMQWANSAGACKQETNVKICCKSSVYSI